MTASIFFIVNRILRQGQIAGPDLSTGRAKWLGAYITNPSAPLIVPNKWSNGTKNGQLPFPVTRSLEFGRGPGRGDRAVSRQYEAMRHPRVHFFRLKSIFGYIRAGIRFME
jgi:hypothetical protein